MHPHNLSVHNIPPYSIANCSCIKIFVHYNKDEKDYDNQYKIINTRYTIL